MYPSQVKRTCIAGSVSRRKCLKIFSFLSKLATRRELKIIVQAYWWRRRVIIFLRVLSNEQCVALSRCNQVEIIASVWVYRHNTLWESTSRCREDYYFDDYSFGGIFIKHPWWPETIGKRSQISKRFFLWEFYAWYVQLDKRSTFWPVSSPDLVPFSSNRLLIFSTYIFSFRAFSLSSLWRNKNPQQWIRFSIKFDHVFLDADVFV